MHLFYIVSARNTKQISFVKCLEPLATNYLFSCPSSSIPTYMELSHHFAIQDQLTSNLLVYNLHLPYKYDGHHG